MENICGKVKLELQVAILTIRLKCIILEDIDFDFHEIRLWTDSQITLSHISNLFLLETKLKSNVDEMCFISRKNNPNDQCTCYNPLTGLTLNSLWIKKLQFLYKNKSVSFKI